MHLYCSEDSYFTDETAVFHAKTDVRRKAELRIRRLPAETVVHQQLVSLLAVPEDPDEYRNGCNWPVVATLRLEELAPGTYACDVEAPGQPTASAVFVVKPRDPATRRRVLIVWPTATMHAYAGWQGRSIYVAGTPVVSRRKPGGLDRRFGAFQTWLEKYGPPCDFAVSTDLHDAEFLSSYALVCSIWHDEYWTLEMRDGLQGWINEGGAALFMSGNTCWWQIRYEDGHRFINYGNNTPPAQDPEAGTARWSVQWHELALLGLGTAENILTGQSSRFAGLTDVRPLPNAEFVIERDHWLFTGTGLTRGQRFGGKAVGPDGVFHDQIIGYECDGAPFVRGVDGTPVAIDDPLLLGQQPPIVIVATADLGGAGWTRYNAQPGQAGVCLLSEHRSDKGRVVSFGTTDWIWRLQNDWPCAESQVAANAVRVLQAGTGRACVWQLAPAARLYEERWDHSTLLDGWHDPEDLALPGDFMGAGHDQALFVNRTGGGGRLMIADFSSGPPANVRYWENWGDSTLLDGWHDPEDIALAGDFMGSGHDQVLFINRTSGGGGRVMIADFASGPPIQVRYWENWGDSATLDGWHDADDLALVGDFTGVGHDQVLFINRTSGGGGRVMIADFANGPPVQVRYWENWGDSPLLDGWHDPEDLAVIGDFMNSGHDQVLFLNRTGGGGRVMIADFASGPPAQVRFWENWGQPSVLDDWDHAESLVVSGDFAGIGYDQLAVLSHRVSGARLLLTQFVEGALPRVLQTIDWPFLNGWTEGRVLSLRATAGQRAHLFCLSVRPRP